MIPASDLSYQKHLKFKANKNYVNKLYLSFIELMKPLLGSDEGRLYISNCILCHLLIGGYRTITSDPSVGKKFMLELTQLPEKIISSLGHSKIVLTSIIQFIARF